MTSGDRTLHEAYVLHVRPWRESSALVELFERELGRVGAVARGVRAGRRGAASPLQPFRPLLVSWRGRGELRTLSTVEPSGHHALAGDALYAGLYVNELLMRLLAREDGHPELWEAYVAALEALAEAGDLEPPLRAFEFRLLESLGYGFALDTDSEGRALHPDARYRFDPEWGLIAIDADGVADADLGAPGGADASVDGGAAVFPGALLLAVAAGELSSPPARSAAKAIARRALAPHLGARPLRARALFGRRRR